MKKSLTIVEMCCGDEMQPEDDTHSMQSESDAGFNTYEQDYSGGEESGAESREEELENSFLKGTNFSIITLVLFFLFWFTKTRRIALDLFVTCLLTFYFFSRF